MRKAYHFPDVVTGPMSKSRNVPSGAAAAIVAVADKPIIEHIIRG